MDETVEDADVPDQHNEEPDEADVINEEYSGDT